MQKDKALKILEQLKNEGESFAQSNIDLAGEDIGRKIDTWALNVETAREEFFGLTRYSMELSKANRRGSRILGDKSTHEGYERTFQNKRIGTILGILQSMKDTIITYWEDDPSDRYLFAANASKKAITELGAEDMGSEQSATSLVGEGDIGTFRLVERIGDPGGFGEVFKCEFPNGSFLAVKFLTEQKGDSLQRFQREIRLLERLSHPNVVEIIVSGVHEEKPYYVMPLYQRSLSSLIREASLTPTRQKTIILEILEGVAYLHAEGVTHRDLKPANILFNSDTDIAITDFGLSRQDNSDSEKLTRIGMVMGTRDYMAPEVRQDANNASHLSDIYSLGVIIEDIVTEFACDEVPSEYLKYIINVCTKRDPSERFQSVAALKDAIEASFNQMMGIIPLSNREAQVERLKMGQLEIDEAVGLCREMIDNDDGDGIESLFSEMTDKVFIQLNAADPELIEQLIVQLRGYVVGREFPFSYTDRVAGYCENFYRLLDDCPAKAGLLYATISVGVYHNRWNALAAGARLHQSLGSNPIAAAEFARLVSSLGDPGVNSLQAYYQVN